MAGAETRVVDGKDDVEVVVTGRTAEAVAAIRALSSDSALENCRVAMEPPGWMTDDCFDDQPESGGRRCPIMARTADSSSIPIDGGIAIRMRVNGRSPEGLELTLEQLRAEIHRRAATYGAAVEPAAR